QIGARADIAKATDSINRYQIDRLMAAVRKHAAPKAIVAVLGMAYKPDTPVVEASQGIMLARALETEGYDVVVHDPRARDGVTRTLGTSVATASSAEDALRTADIAVIVTPWPEYAQLGQLSLARPIPIIDCWRILPRKSGSLRPVWLGYGERATISSAT